jgi:chemotaxis protein methyltransferase CheR
MYESKNSSMNSNQMPARDPGREFKFTAKDFRQIQQMIYTRAGISLGQSKQDMVYSRLARRLRATGLRSFHDSLELLEGNDETEWEAFINSLTTNLTSFFREQHHFPMLAEHALKQAVRHRVALWCSASSTGRALFDGDDAGGPFERCAARFVIAAMWIPMCCLS